MNRGTSSNLTKCFLAARSGNKEIVELLISKGADLNIKDRDGRTPLYWARNKDLVDLLMKHGAKL